RSVAFIPGGRTVVSASDDGTVRVWELTQGEAPAVVAKEEPVGKDRILGKDLGRVAGVAFSAAGDRAAAACGDRTGGVWEVASGRELALLAGHEQPVRSVAFAPDGHHLVSAGLDGKLLLWDLKAKTIKRQFGGHAGPVNGVAVSADGRHLLSGGRDKT